MGLAAYGEPERLETFREIVQFDTNGNSNGFRLGLQYFAHHRDGPEMSWADAKTPTLGKLYSERMAQKLGAARGPEEPVEQRHRNLAASLQARLEEVYLGILRKLANATGLKSVCLAGGVAFNCVANGKIFDNTPFEQVYVQPAAGDAGLAIGAAYYVWHQKLRKPRSFVMDHAYWGPGFSTVDIRAAIASSVFGRGGYVVAELPEQELTRRAAQIIADGKILGWFQGRAEWGPRALGNRSIVADPRRADMKDILNRRIKHREIFRPFAPSILAEATGEWFDKAHPSPFMTLAYGVRPEKRALIPAPTHVDGTGRLQTVARDANPRFHALISAFRDMTGVPLVLNTSFNDNEPIVCRPEEAIDCFLRTKMDALVLGDFLVTPPMSARGQAEE
jgi:carbamoyltransferase